MKGRVGDRESGRKGEGEPVISIKNFGETLCPGALVAKKKRTPERCKSKTV
jgi:hypothetical protein